MARHRWVAAWLAAGALFTCQTALARAPVPIDGNCAAGDPRIVGPPGAEIRLRAQGATWHCGAGGELVVTYPEQPVSVPGRDMPALTDMLRPTPNDFGGWAYVWVNGQQLTMPLRKPGSDAFEPEAYVVGSTSRTVMPIRFFTEAIGGAALWDEANRAAILQYGERVIQLPIGSRQALVDGQPVEIDQPAFIWLERTMVPTRFLLEAFGAQIEWHPMDSAVVVTLAGARCSNTRLCAQTPGGERA